LKHVGTENNIEQLDTWMHSKHFETMEQEYVNISSCKSLFDLMGDPCKHFEAWNNEHLNGLNVWWLKYTANPHIGGRGRDVSPTHCCQEKNVKIWEVSAKLPRKRSFKSPESAALNIF
jgi:hypothetical protein